MRSAGYQGILFIPDVTGMAINQARQTLYQWGATVKVRGQGNAVAGQQPPPGKDFPDTTLPPVTLVGAS
jgi:beta-lactam-binding protein with PASTA domain